jgi:hypothetical protein
MRQKFVDYLIAASLVVAFGGLFFGRLMIYPVSTASGTFLERVAAESSAWSVGHRVMLVGMMALIPAALGLRLILRERSPWLCDLSATLAVVGAALGVGQYALDFAMLAAAQIESAAAREEFLTALKSDAFTQWAFYKLPDVGQLGLVLFTVALWRQGQGWRLQAALVTLAAATALLGPPLFGTPAVRVGLGLAMLGFSSVAWKIAMSPNLRENAG